MSYSESTSVANRAAFITAFINFAVANAGFADEGTTVDGSDTIYHISKGSIFWNFYEHTITGQANGTIYEIKCKMSFAKILTVTAFESTTTAGQRYPTQMILNGNVGPYVKYFLYTDGNAVHCCLQIYTSIFSHLSFGNIIKSGVWTGGEYVTAHGGGWPSASVYSDFDVVLNSIYFDGGTHSTSGNNESGYIRYIVGSPVSDKGDFARIGATTVDNQRCYAGITHDIYKVLVEDCGPISVNIRAPLYSIPIQILEYATSRNIVAGHVPYVRVMSIKEIPPATIVENDWIVFPVSQRTGGDNTLASLSFDWGIAYKRVA